MIRMFVGMIIGACSAIVLLGGPTGPDRIQGTMRQIVDPLTFQAGLSTVLMLVLTGGAIGLWSWWHKRTAQRSHIEKSYITNLLRYFTKGTSQFAPLYKLKLPS